MKTKILTRVLLAVMCLALLLGVFSGCGKTEDTTPVTVPQPDNQPAPAEQAPAEPTVTIKLNQLSVGSEGGQVKTIQRIIYARGINPDIEVDGEFGPITKGGVMLLQKQLFPGQPSEWDGVVGQKTWQAALTQLI